MKKLRTNEEVGRINKGDIIFHDTEGRRLKYIAASKPNINDRWLLKIVEGEGKEGEEISLRFEEMIDGSWHIGN